MTQNDNFIEIPFVAENLDRFYTRTSILNALKEELPKFQGSLLDIGCGKMPYRGLILENSRVTNYTGLDIEQAIIYDESVRPDFTWDGVTMPFQEHSFDCAFGTEVLEHCPKPEIVLAETYRILRPGGIFFFTVPFLWPLHEVPHDEFRYTPFALQRILKESGFENIQIKATGGWHASLAQMLGLWVRRAKIERRKRRILSILLKPVINFLVDKDQNLNKDFKEGQMITGLFGTARKL